MSAGWIVEVEDEAGALLFAVRSAAPHDAENIVRKKLGLSKGKEVFAARPIEAKALEKLGVGIDEIRGPM